MKRLLAIATTAILVSGCGGSDSGGAASSGRQTLPAPANAYFSSLTAIWAFSDTDVWAVGDRVLHFDGSKWSEVQGPGPGITLSALWGLAPDDLWATSGSKIFRYRGPSAGWTELVHGIPNPPDFSAIWVSAPDDYVVGGGDVNSEIVRVKGTTVSRAFTYGATTGIWGANANDIWAVSEQGGFFHWDGTKWSKVEPTGGAGQRPHGVWGFSATDVWAVGTDDAPQHWDGTAWTAASSSQGGFSAVWGSASNDVWAAGDHGALSHYDGKTWKDTATDHSVSFTAMSGSGAKSVWSTGFELSTAGNHGVVFKLQ